MKSRPVKISNDYGEKLDAVIEGNEASKEIIVFVHGYGTDKDEGFASFIDLSNAFSVEYFVIRYDQSGYGNSEGQDKAYNLQKSAGDLNSVLKWARASYPDKPINIIAHSLGGFVCLVLSPLGIKQLIITSIVNSDTDYVISNLQDRINKAGGEINEDGISVYPRSKGGKQLIGSEFWQTLRHLDPPQALKELAKQTKVVIFKAQEDDVLGELHFDEYKDIEGVEYAEVRGDHNFTDLNDRQNIIEEIKTRL